MDDAGISAGSECYEHPHITFTTCSCAANFKEDIEKNFCARCQRPIVDTQELV